MSRSSAARSSLLAGLFLGLVVLLIKASGGAQGQNAASDPPPLTPHPVLVELFTSEGCSSCPPADLLLQRLDSSQPIPGAQLIVLSEHVTYWDQDGWKDPNSSSALTDRQNSYEGALGEQSPFTPQLIVDGSHEVKLGNARQIEDVLTRAASAPKVALRISNVAINPADASVVAAHIETDPNLDKHNADVYVAVALDHVESQVLRGENGGLHLVHVAVVQQLVKVGRLPKGKSFARDVQLKLKSAADPKNLRLIAFAQESGPGKLLGAVLLKPAD